MKVKSEISHGANIGQKDPVESPACVTPKFICNDVIARLAKWRVLATTGVCASARTELKRQRFLDIGVTDLCGKIRIR